MTEQRKEDKMGFVIAVWTLLLIGFPLMFVHKGVGGAILMIALAVAVGGMLSISPGSRRHY